MKTWYLTPKTPTDNGNDLILQDGQIRMVSDIEALRVRIDSALQVFKGELQDPTQGVDYFGVIFSKTPLSMKVQELCRVISSIEGVESVTFDNADVNNKTGEITFHFTIKSVYGELVYDKIIENNA